MDNLPWPQCEDEAAVVTERRWNVGKLFCCFRVRRRCRGGAIGIVDLSSGVMIALLLCCCCCCCCASLFCVWSLSRVSSLVPKRVMVHGHRSVILDCNPVNNSTSIFNWIHWLIPQLSLNAELLLLLLDCGEDMTTQCNQGWVRIVWSKKHQYSYSYSLISQQYKWQKGICRNIKLKQRNNYLIHSSLQADFVTGFSLMVCLMDGWSPQPDWFWLGGALENHLTHKSESIQKRYLLGRLSL